VTFGSAECERFWTAPEGLHYPTRRHYSIRRDAGRRESRRDRRDYDLHSDSISDSASSDQTECFESDETADFGSDEDTDSGSDEDTDGGRVHQ
jgi:hypothetical protein